MKNEIFKLAIVLFIITAIAGLVLSTTNEFTKEKIIAVQEKKKSGPEVANSVVPGAVSIEKYDENIVNAIKKENEKIIDIRQCKDSNGNLLGYGIYALSTLKGYGGYIEVIVGISTGGKVVGMNIVSHKETAGLGSGITKKDFQSQYFGNSTDKEFEVTRVKKNETDIEAISGATISSKSVTSAVNNAMNIYNKFIRK